MPDGKFHLTRDQIVRKALDARHQVSFVVKRAETNEESEDDRTIQIICATDNPCTHFLWSKWEYVDIQLAMNKNAMRAKRFENGAAFLMDHNTGDQRGVIEDFAISKGELRATVRMSPSPRGEELYQDIKAGIRRQISLGFMIHHLVLVEERENEPDLYEARDWEPYEASSVAVAADIDAKVMRAIAARRDGLTNCPDCSETLRDCICDDQQFSNAQKRAISTNGEKNMKDPNGNGTGTDPVVEKRSPDLLVADEIRDWGKAFGNEAEATAYCRQNTTDDGKFVGTKEGFFKAIREATPPAVKVPPMSAEDAARMGGGGFDPNNAGSMVVDTKTREILESRGLNFDDKQIASISTRGYKLAFREYLQKGIAGMGIDARRTLNEGKDSDGGFLVPPEFLAQMIERQPAPTSVAGQVTRLQTGSDKLQMPKNNYSASNLYTTPVRVNWVGGDTTTGPSAEESNANLFGQIEIPIHTAMMYLDVTRNQIEDTQFDIVSWLTNKFSETADVVTENMVINGSGIGQPRGILANPNGTDEPAFVVSGSAASVTADGLFDLAYALLSRYRAGATFVFNSTSTEKTIAKLKDAQNRYLFSYGMADYGIASARPQSLIGYPIINSDFMPDLAANAFPIIFGDLKGYYLAERIGFTVQVLEEIVATANKVRVLGRMRIGGQVAEDWKLKIQKCSA